MNILRLGLPFLLWGFVHSLLASLEAKALARRFFGPSVDRYYRLGYNLFSVLSLLPVGWIWIHLPDKNLYAFHLPWLAVTAAVQVLALVALAAGVLQTGAFAFVGLAQIFGSAGPARLVTGGLYRFVRHPLYTAGLVLIWLAPVMTVNRLILCAAATLYIVVGAWFEERKLRREYRDEYIRYAASTPMFIPFLKWNKPAR